MVECGNPVVHMGAAHLIYWLTSESIVQDSLQSALDASCCAADAMYRDPGMVADGCGPCSGPVFAASKLAALESGLASALGSATIVFASPSTWTFEGFRQGVVHEYGCEDGGFKLAEDVATSV